jgi:hypothetical protein
VTRQVLRQPVYVVRYGVDDSIRQRPVSGDRRNQTVGVDLRNRCTTGQQTVQIGFVDSYVVVRKLPNELVVSVLDQLDTPILGPPLFGLVRRHRTRE